MCYVRPATPDDIDAIAVMGARFFDYSRFGTLVHWDHETVKAALLQVHEAGVIFVALRDEAIAGFLAGALASIWFAPATLAATEFAWWVEPEHRQSAAGLKLLRAFEAWAREQGAALTVFSDLVLDGETPAGDLFACLGYVVVERSHVKRIG